MKKADVKRYSSNGQSTPQSIIGFFADARGKRKLLSTPVFVK
jgi:hypothetical protein